MGISNELDSYKQEKATLENKIDIVITIVKSQIEKFEKHEKQSQNQIKSLNDNLEIQKQINENLTQLNTNLAEKNSSLEKKVGELKVENKNLVEKVSCQEKKINQLNSSIELKEKEISDLKNEPKRNLDCLCLLCTLSTAYEKAAQRQKRFIETFLNRSRHNRIQDLT